MKPLVIVLMIAAAPLMAQDAELSYYGEHHLCRMPLRPYCRVEIRSGIERQTEAGQACVRRMIDYLTEFTRYRMCLHASLDRADDLLRDIHQFLGCAINERDWCSIPHQLEIAPGE